MVRISSAALAVLFVALSAGSSAQEPHHPRISLYQPGFGKLKDDLKSLLDLTTPAEQEQWTNIKDYIDLFMIGVAPEKAIRAEVLAGVSPTPSFFTVPLLEPEDKSKKPEDEFRDNLDSLGYPTVRDAQDRTLFKIEGDPDFGWLRVFPAQKYAAVVITTDKADLAILRQVVLRISDPMADIAKLAEVDAGITAEIVNTTNSAEDQAKRRSALAELRRVTLDTIQKRPDESSTEYELRRMAMDHQLDEGERLLVEAAEIRASGKYDPARSSAVLNFSARAIEGTSLAETIRQFGKQPCAYGSVPPLAGSALTLRVNHPIDSQRQENAVEFITLARKDVEGRIEASRDMSADQKAAMRQFMDGLQTVTTDGIRSGYINAMIESVPEDATDFTIVGGVSLPNAPRLNELLPLLAKTGEGNVAEMNVAKVGEIPVHRIRLRAGFIAVLDRIFGKEKDLFIGLEANRIWLASGSKAVAAMTTVVGSIGEPVMTPVTIHAHGHLLPFVKRYDEIAKSAPEGKTPEEKEAKRAGARTRARAIAALETDDLLSVTVMVENDVVSGEMAVDKGIMRFIGKAMAAFAKENLSSK